MKDHRSSVRNQHTQNKTKQKTTTTRKRQTNKQQQQQQNCKPKTNSKTKSIQAVGLNEIRTYDSLSFRPFLGVRREEISAEGGGERERSFSPFAFSPKRFFLRFVPKKLLILMLNPWPMPLHCSSHFVIKPAGNWSLCGFVIYIRRRWRYES